MPSVKNPNGPSKNRLANRALGAKIARRKKSEANRHQIARTDTMRGARPGLMPTSGPNAPMSKKKAKKMEKKIANALRRQMEANGEVIMQDAEGTAEKPEEGDMETEIIA
ncbi:hypothetical protein BDP55DRAFT_632720 [Colletotrichum godetiae]|uniref:Ribosome biogenesis protein ALB1 n=1 Tax=Colletotrichum godetiae TaxID=1209918 RepID=A0AAJ0AMH2_9PEZI|nr:uncharacterized protein BDP55DRAFT_632720 [Colletotrichum godetiae]KAK1675092.1 hypothetical protein BDP55DRAFT_632720 [Colletotrichum godetiae]